MELTIDIVGEESFLFPDFERDGGIYRRTEIELSKGITLRYDQSIFCESVDAPTFIQISVIIGKEILLPIALGLVSSWLYDKIKDKKAYKISINGREAELNKQKLLELMKQEIKEKAPLKQHFIKIRTSGMKNRDLRLSARTLSRKPIVFDGEELSYSDNMVDFADYVLDGIAASLVLRNETLNAILEKRMILYAIAETELTPFNHEIFTKLILSSKRILSSHRIQYLEKTCPHKS
jgi:hypothetical protein